MEGNPHKELEASLKFLESLSKQDPEKLKKKLYDSLTAVSYLIIEAKKAKFKKGWAAKLLDRHNDPLFDKNDAVTLEGLIDTIIKPIFDKSQKGGTLDLVPSKMIQPAVPLINPDDISIDKTYEKVKNYLKGLNVQSHSLSRELGPYKYFYDTDASDIHIPIPTPSGVPIQVPIAPRAIPIMIGAFIEAVRLFMSFGVMPNPVARQIISVILAISDLFEGKWKNAILSFAGVFGQYPLVVGILGKLALNAFDLIPSDKQDKLLYTLFTSSKSFILGFYLWAISTFSPEFMRTIIKDAFKKLDTMVQDLNGKIKVMEDSMQKSLGSTFIIKFNRISQGSIPSFEDMKNLQTIATQPAIICSRDFQDIIKPLLNSPPVRLFLELCGIPTTKDALDLECEDLAGKSIDDNLKGLMTPEVTINPAAIPQVPIPQVAIPQVAIPQVAIPQVPTPQIALPVKRGGTRLIRRKPKKTRKLR